MDFDFKSLYDNGIIPGNSDNSEITKMFNTSVESMKKEYSELMNTRYIDYHKFHDAFLELGFFGKILPECNFTQYNTIKELFNLDDYDVYYLNKLYVQKYSNSTQYGLLVLLPKNYSSKVKQSFIVIAIQEDFCIPEFIVEFYYPYINTLFRLKKFVSKTYVFMLSELIDTAIKSPFKNLKRSRCRSTNSALSYTKTKL